MDRCQNFHSNFFFYCKLHQISLSDIIVMRLYAACNTQICDEIKWMSWEAPNDMTVNFPCMTDSRYVAGEVGWGRCSGLWWMEVN